MQLLHLFKTARNVIYTKFTAQSYQLLKPLPAYSFHLFFFSSFFFFFFSGQNLVLEIPQTVIILLVLHYLALFIYWWSASSEVLPDESRHPAALKGTFLGWFTGPVTLQVLWTRLCPHGVKVGRCTENLMHCTHQSPGKGLQLQLDQLWSSGWENEQQQNFRGDSGSPSKAIHGVRQKWEWGKFSHQLLMGPLQTCLPAALNSKPGLVQFSGPDSLQRSESWWTF